MTSKIKHSISLLIVYNAHPIHSCCTNHNSCENAMCKLTMTYPHKQAGEVRAYQVVLHHKDYLQETIANSIFTDNCDKKIILFRLNSM